ncbi:MAG: polysaccharide deacetylase family protein [Leptothrix sp. (in: b-proteobacteria)]
MWSSIVLWAGLCALAQAAPAREAAREAVRDTARPWTEIHQRFTPHAAPEAAPDAAAGQAPTGPAEIALTLDACGGQFDAELVDLLIAHRVPATVFVTQRWLDRNPQGTAVLLAHADLFELQDHGAQHVPAIVGHGKRVYGLSGEPDLAHLQSEVSGAALAITALTGHAPTYYRGAGAVYDAQAVAAIHAMGYQIAGFSLNADAGATLPADAVARHLLAARSGDVVIAHMNKPASQTAEGFMQALPQLQARGVRFVKLSAVTLKPE